MPRSTTVTPNRDSRSSVSSARLRNCARTRSANNRSGELAAGPASADVAVNNDASSIRANSPAMSERKRASSRASAVAESPNPRK